MPFNVEHGYRRPARNVVRDHRTNPHSDLTRYVTGGTYKPRQRAGEIIDPATAAQVAAASFVGDKGCPRIGR